MTSTGVAMGAKRWWVLKTAHTGLKEQEILTDMENNIFCESTNSEVDYFLFFGTVELENSLWFDKKYFGRSHFRFVIFSLV